MEISTGSFPTIEINGGVFERGIIVQLSHDAGSALTRERLLRRTEELPLDVIQ